MPETVYTDDAFDRTILREALATQRAAALAAEHTDELVLKTSAHEGEENCEAFGDAKALALEVEGRALVEQAKPMAAILTSGDKNSAALGVQADRNASSLSVQADRNFSALGVQVDRNAAEARLMLETKSNALAVQAQTFASAATLQAQTVASATAAQIAACCCALKERIRDSEDITRADSGRQGAGPARRERRASGGSECSVHEKRCTARARERVSAHHSSEGWD